MTIREKLVALWHEIDGPIGIAMLVGFVFFAGTQYQFWRDANERAQATRERDNAAHERDMLYSRIRGVHDSEKLACANDKGALIQSFREVGAQRDVQIRELFRQNNTLIALTRERQVTTEQVLRNTVATAQKVDEAAASADIAAKKADEAAQKADVTQTAIEKATQQPIAAPPQPWAGKRK